MCEKERKKTHRLGAFSPRCGTASAVYSSLYFTTNDQLGRPEDLGHRIARQASIVAGVSGGDALDNYGAGMTVNVGYAQPRGCLRVMSGIVYDGDGGRRAGGGNRLAVLRPDDRERRIALLDHAGHLGPQALRQVLLKAKGSYGGRNCTKKERENMVTVSVNGMFVYTCVETCWRICLGGGLLRC